MDRRRLHREPAAIDITWISCRGVKSHLLFHTPCLHASVSVSVSSAAAKKPGRRPHRVKTPTDRAGGENPEWDTPLRLYLPDTAEQEGAEEKESGGGAVLLLRFKLKTATAVLGDVLAASATVAVADLAADGLTHRVSYQLAAPDGKHPNGVISFSYAFHDDGGKNDEDSSDTVASPSSLAAPAVTAPPARAAASGMYPMIDWLLTEQVAIYPPVAATTTATAKGSYYPPPPPVAPTEPIAVYPPLPDMAYGVPAAKLVEFYPPLPDTTCGAYPPVSFAPLSGYPPPPEWDGRSLYG